MPNYLSIDYLKEGNEKQRKAYGILQRHQILEVLHPYNPIVVGTIPIEIDTPSSDVDIVCWVQDFDQFHEVVHKHFGELSGFNYQLRSDESYVASFRIDGLEFELYAVDKPTTEQNGYLHMIIEDRLLKLFGNQFRQRIIALKLQGYKTEPAFGLILDLANPYEELLDLLNKTDEELSHLFRNKVLF